LKFCKQIRFRRILGIRLAQGISRKAYVSIQLTTTVRLGLTVEIFRVGTILQNRGFLVSSSLLSICEKSKRHFQD